MNFIAFYVSNTNLFPIANSHAGGQLLSEFNLRSRETVNTDPNVKYPIGPSFTHSDTDFEVTLETDGVGNPISTTAIQISAGRALVNGHYVESLIKLPAIDIVEANAALVAKGEEPMSGTLCVGLRAMYSTDATMSGSLLTETDGNMYAGIQVVILPKFGDLGKKFTLPSDSPDNEELVNAHLKLAEFDFLSGSILSDSIIQNPDRSACMSASRISNISDVITGEFITKDGLNPKRIYTFSGKGSDPSTGYDTWCDSTDSLIVWDRNPDLQDGQNPGVSQAQFQYLNIDLETGKDQTQLVLPHKQPEGMESSGGESQYYKDVKLNIPAADYVNNTGGVINKAYTENIKNIAYQVDKITLGLAKCPNCKNMIKYIPQLNSRLWDEENQETSLPEVDVRWNAGDYIIVGEDNTVGATLEDGSAIPSTMYIVLPPLVDTASYVSGNTDTKRHPDSSNLEGVELAYVRILKSEAIEDPTKYYTGEFANYDIFNLRVVSSTTNQITRNYRGINGTDYFTLAVEDDDTHAMKYYFYTCVPSSSVQDCGYTYSDPIWITASTTLATTTNIGGFYNVDSSVLGGGYVHVNDEGHLQLLDYELLSSGVLAYQLGQDVTIASGNDIATIQSELDESVNQRVAFPNTEQAENAEDSNVINVTFTLQAGEDEAVQELNLYDIDSRFNTSVYVHILGSANSYTTINISNCEKIRLDIQATGNFHINLYNSNLYYDSDVLQRLEIIEGLRLWYERYNTSQPNLIVDGMTVTVAEKPDTILNTEYWANNNPNDNHYSYALRSLTFNANGYVTGCSIFVTDTTTGNVDDGTYLAISEITVPQSLGFSYPVNRFNNQMKVSGTFVTCYPVDNPEAYLVKSTEFSALTYAYDGSDTKYAKGQIAIHTTISHVSSVTGISAGTSIDAWESGKFHIFSGGVVNWS